MTRKTIKILSLVGLVTIMYGCYPGGSIPIDDLDTTSTYHVEADFSPPHASAAIFWDVAKIESGDNTDLPYNGEVDDEILNTTLSNLVSIYGEANVYIISETATPVPTPNNSNVTVISDGSTPNVEAIYSPSIKLSRETIGIVYPGYPWYPGWDGGWWGPGWGGCYYCYYPPTISYQSYDIGSVILDLVDARKFVNDVPPNEITPSWVAINRGLISSNSEFNAQRVIDGINKAFNQSPYLK